MLSVDEALGLVVQNAVAKSAREVALTEAQGLILAADIASDVDSPPHDKSMVDGYAVRTADFSSNQARLTVVEEITAGSLPTKSIVAGTCSRIMTGAELPNGADAVVMVERSRLDGNLMELHDDRLRAGQNIMRRGTSMRTGETVLRRGIELGPAEIGLLAEVGRTKIQVVPPPNVAILATGNELVSADKQPARGQIRNSNGPLLVAAAHRAGGTSIDLGIARDDAAALRQAIGTGLNSDILVLSGGVSAGVLDLVPSVLAELGVQEVFHKIRMKPGKPLWFGVHSPFPLPHSPLQSTLVFGLPGNPVSSLVCFELFVKPAIGRLSGRKFEPPHPTRPAVLSNEFQHRGDRPTYHPSILTEEHGGKFSVASTPWRGSADLRGFAGANALIVFPAGERRYQAGESIDVIVL
ncbi:MAG TPA: gephyrin-like molybdotransferase Glp [Pirellulales bacterium]|jgi:molybdopterin molybdotransferase